MNRPKTKILVDGGDPRETVLIKELLGFVDGQTTNPTLISRNPHIKALLDSGHKLSNREELNEYKKIVSEISPLVGEAGVSIEVFADRNHDRANAIVLTRLNYQNPPYKRSVLDRSWTEIDPIGPKHFRALGPLIL